ncbi:hypothetical protein BV898_12049 [Hypsibius exemplaris]|uniref:Gustatory receptor n=1 Tax=Hypsibius exemplaris TaxID=2072580 RepID=A0A1W0WEV0_HYPEX|nr:hypothetical protein BV898_12049 [Hypsibius exemplaris]
MASDIAHVQAFLLAANEATSPANTGNKTLTSRWYNGLLTLVRITFTLGSISIAVIDCADIIMISLESVNENTPFVISMVQMFWVTFYESRSASVLALFTWCHLARWRALRTFVRAKMMEPLNHRNAKQSSDIRRLSWMLFLISFGLRASNMAFSWLQTEGLLEDPKNFSLNLTSCYSWFDRCVSRETFILVETFLVDWPFILSQQVLISGLIFVWIALKSMRKLRREVATNLTVTSSDEVPSSERIENWTLSYVNMSRFVQYFNGCFGRILLVSVGLDVLTVLGVCAKLLASGKTLSMMIWLRYAWVSVIFLSYATICYLPFILLHEESLKLDRILRDFAWTLNGHGEERSIVTKEEISADLTALQEKVNKLSLIVKENPLTIEAGGLFQFSRTSLVTIVTTVVTALLLTKEILNRSMPARF